MSVPKSQSCCCCVSLRTGVLTIALLDLVLGVLSLVTLFCAPTLHSHITPSMPGSDYNGKVMMNVLHSVFSIIFSLYLIMGVKQNNPRKMRPWVYVSFVKLILYIIISAFLSIEMAKVDKSELYYIIPIVIIITVLSSYCWFVVYSYYKKLKNDQDLQTILECEK